MAETELEIHNRMLTKISDEYDKTDGSFIYDATRPPSIEFAQIQGDISTVESKLDIQNLKEDELSRFVYTRTGIIRKSATYATSILKIVGNAGTRITQGDLTSTPSGALYEFIESVVIDNTGVINAKVICQSSGAVGNTPANTITILPISIDGVISVTNDNAVTNGYDAETDDDLRLRYFDKLQRPGKAGNKYHFEEWAKSVVGVGDARCVPRYNGPLSVKVIIIDSNGLPGSTELVTTTRKLIESEMSFGVEDLSVIGAVAVPINLSVTLRILSSADSAIVTARIKANIKEYLKELAFQSDRVSYAKIGALIIETNGVADYENLLVNGATANVEILDDQVAIVGGVNE